MDSSAPCVPENKGRLQEIALPITGFIVWMRDGGFARMRVRANKFREVEGGGTTWYASRTEAVGLGRVVPSSSTDF